MTTYVAPLNVDEFKMFLAGELTVKEHKVLLKSVIERCNYIVRKIHDIYEMKLDWWDFDNCYESDEDGTFDTESYQNEVLYVGERSKSKKFDSEDSTFSKSIHCLCSGGKSDGYFPTEYIYTNFEELEQKLRDEFYSQTQIKSEKKKTDSEKYLQIQNVAVNKVKSFIKTLSIEEQATLSSVINTTSFSDWKQYQRTVKNLQSKNFKK